MEAGFRHDFSRVRVHADVQAGTSAEHIGALAYTVGHQIVFGRGQYRPETGPGRRLLAHELAHVVQQSGASDVAAAGITPACDPAEREADAAASRVVGGESVAPAVLSRRAVAHVQRQSDEGVSTGGTGSTTYDPVNPAPAPPITPPQPPPPHFGPDVYMCWAPTEAAPFASHTWYRIGGPEPRADHETFSLFPKLTGKKTDGSKCAQGVPVRGSVDGTDIVRPGTCVKTPLNSACIESQFAHYPVGYYCPAGPNSNTFAGAVGRACNLPTNIQPTDLVPGFGDVPPPASTFGPNWLTMAKLDVIACGPIECSAGAAAQGGDEE
jgi:hypothetical protein